MTSCFRLVHLWVFSVAGATVIVAAEQPTNQVSASAAQSATNEMAAQAPRDAETHIDVVTAAGVVSSSTLDAPLQQLGRASP